MALHRYFKPISGKLPDPNGPLSKEMPSGAIKEANKSVEQGTEAQNNFDHTATCARHSRLTLVKLYLLVLTQDS